MVVLSAFHAKRVSMLRNRLIRDVSKLQGVGWKALARQARSELSIEDLDQCGKAGRALSKEGLEMLEQIAAVGGCGRDSRHEEGLAQDVREGARPKFSDPSH